MTERHESSCARHNEPAYPNGPCDCKYREQNMPVRRIVPVEGSVVVGRAEDMPPEALEAFEAQYFRIRQPSR